MTLSGTREVIALKEKALADKMEAKDMKHARDIVTGMDAAAVKKMAEDGYDVYACKSHKAGWVRYCRRHAVGVCSKCCCPRSLIRLDSFVSASTLYPVSLTLRAPPSTCRQGGSLQSE